MTKEERRAAKRRPTRKISAGLRDRNVAKKPKRREQEELSERAVNPSVKVVTALEAEDSEEDDNYDRSNGANPCPENEIANRWMMNRNGSQMNQKKTIF